MECKVLLFGFSKRADKELIAALRARGFGITATVSLTRLHLSLASRRYSAIIVPDRVVNRYKMAVSRHLWQTGAPLTVISVGPDTDREAVGWKYAVHRGPIPGGGGLCALDEGIDRLLETIANAKTIAIETAGSETLAAESGPAYRNAAFPEGLDPASFHEKMGDVLKAIICSGESGIDGRALGRCLWPRSRRDRRKDIQIYVSKIRKRLNSVEPNRFSIRCDKGVYRFSDSRLP